MRDLIVCGTDFSPQSEGALAWAGAIARRGGGRIDLVHVVPAPNRDPEALATDVVTFEAEVRRLASERLTAAVAAAAEQTGVEVRGKLLTGDAHQELTDHAGKEQAQMLVLGASARSTLERWVLGDVTERTVRAASCPVVVVPRAFDPYPWSAAVGPNKRSPRVLVGMDLTGADAGILEYVADLRRKAPCDVTFLHLYWPIEEYTRLGLRGPRALFETDPEVVKNLEPKLRSKVGGLPGSGKVDTDIRAAWGEPATNLERAVDEQQADLLVVGTEQRHGLNRLFKGSVAERLARHAHKMPVVCVPTPAAAGDRPARLPHVVTVLAVTDLSPLGNAAIPHAYGLLRAGGVVELCHVFERSVPSPGYVYDRSEHRLSDEQRAAIEKQLRALIPRQVDEIGITTHVSVIDGGKPAEAIVQASERLGADVITLGSHGRSGLARAVLGSVAQEVVGQARRPVLVVRSR